MKLTHIFTLGFLIVASAALVSAQVTVTPSTLNFQAQVGGVAQPLDAVLSVIAGPPGSFTVKTDQPWVFLYNLSNSGAPIQSGVLVQAPANINVQLNNTPIAPGTYQSTISFYQGGTANAVAYVYVTLTVVSAATGNLVVTPSALTFNYQFGGPFPAAQNLAIAATNNSSISFNISASTVTGGRWLSVGTNSYFTPSFATVSAIPLAGMAPGVYTGAVFVNPTGGGATQTIPVTLVVSSGGTLSATPSSLTFNYQSGGALPAPQTVTVVNVLGGNVAYTVLSATSGGGNWLGTSTTGSVTPSSFLVNVSPLTLSPGTYYGSVSIYQSGTTVPSSQIPITLNVGSASQLTASPTQLTYNYIVGGAAPPSQFISVTSTGAAITFTSTVSGPTWVTVSSSRATTPTAVSVNVAPPAGVAAGTYSASVLMTPAGGGAAVATPVTVNVTAANYLSVNPSTVSIDYKLNGPNPAPDLVYVTSSGGSTRFDAIAATSGFGSWLKVSQSSQYTPATVTVTVAPQGLAAGTYSGVVSIVADTANNSPQSINVTLTVTNSSTFSSNPFGLSFSYQAGQADPPLQAGLISSGGQPLPFSLSTSTSSGGGWLLAAGSGTTPGTYISGISPNQLAPGTYSGSINVQPADNTLTPLQVPVILNVASGPVFAPGANQLSFLYRTSGPNPAAQKVTVGATGGGLIVYYPTAQTADGGQWLQVAPTTAVTSSDVSVSINPGGLAAGQYYGVVALNDAAAVAPVSYIPVSLQVSAGPILSVAEQPLQFTATAGGTPPAAQQITVGGNGTAVPYHVDTSASWLQVLPTDGTTDGVLSVVASPSLSAGYYVGSITISIPGVSGSQQYVPVVFVVH